MHHVGLITYQRFLHKYKSNPLGTHDKIEPHQYGSRLTQLLMSSTNYIMSMPKS